MTEINGHEQTISKDFDTYIKKKKKSLASLIRGNAQQKQAKVQSGFQKPYLVKIQASNLSISAEDNLAIYLKAHLPLRTSPSRHTQQSLAGLCYKDTHCNSICNRGKL